MTLGCKRACEVTTELKKPVILLAQVGRKAELREDAKPTLYDLKSTGSLREDAQSLLYSPEVDAPTRQMRPRSNQYSRAQERRRKPR